jgi:acetoin utilization deacetylase AcuC-like enzyme
MKAVFHPGYHTPLPPGHPFPMSKYPLLRDRILDEKLIAPHDILEPTLLDRSTLGLVHTEEYLDKLSGPGLSGREERRLGLPWSSALWLRVQLACAGTLLAAYTARREGLAANLAGGTHHAFADHAEGFCVLNDVGVAIRKLQTEHLAIRALIVDLDVHQGNGTAALFAGDPSVFTFSMHGARNYPLQKMQSSLDIALPDGSHDELYLEELTRHLPRAMDAAQPDIAFYLAGVDVAAGDRYGRLALSDDGILRRDSYVIETLRSGGVPLAMVLGGGYASSRERTVELHLQLFRAAARYERQPLGALA